MPELNSCLYTGHVTHHRFKPVDHRFVYRVFSSLIDLDELSALDRFKLFSVNRFNLFSFNEKDHGRGKGDLVAYIRSLLNKQQREDATHRIQLLCYPRILGYAFNPLSVYFCYDLQGDLSVILYEVSNTFGSRHIYLIDVEKGSTLIDQHCEKQMYVSPFMPMNTDYSFHIHPPKNQVSVFIQLSDHQAGANDTQPLLNASFNGKRQEICDQALFSMFCKYPLMTVKVIAGIHWEALKLWRKKLKIQPREKHVTHTISWKDKNGAMHYESL